MCFFIWSCPCVFVSDLFCCVFHNIVSTLISRSFLFGPIVLSIRIWILALFGSLGLSVVFACTLPFLVSLGFL